MWTSFSLITTVKLKNYIAAKALKESTNLQYHALEGTAKQEFIHLDKTKTYLS
jgi:hypothetical protein